MSTMSKGKVNAKPSQQSSFKNIVPYGSGSKSYTRNFDKPEDYVTIQAEPYIPSPSAEKQDQLRHRSFFAPRHRPSYEEKIYANQVYKIKFSIHYETAFGQYLCIMGSLPQFGEWVEQTCKLEWSEGHIWTTQVEVNSLEPFEYKYVIMQKGMEPIWECDPNRIADLRLV